MICRSFSLVLALALGATVALAADNSPAATTPRAFDVKAFGATGDGKTLDSPAINAAIEAAGAAGGGTVHFPAGTYLSGSIRLTNNIALYLDQGATIEATSDPKAYDAPEPNEWGDKFQYQDFGHSHWHNSLIWGDGLENITIAGPGRIVGRALSRGMNRGSPGGSVGNKSIALRLCRNVSIRDISMLECGHFALLLTGVDNLTLDNLKVDTNRDGFDIDCCRNVRVSNCSVNAPNDDAIVLKSSFGLGFARATENVTIVNCQVSGYDLGSFLDGTFKRTQALAPDRDGVTGRIKFGTESNGGFKNITIANCVFDRCRGLALETVDGGLLEDISISNITMRDIVNAPIFLRLGSRMRGPANTPVGQLRRVNISNVVVYNADAFYSSIISGIPGHEIEDVRLSNIRIYYQGGGTKADAAIAPPESANGYPEPSMFGTIPAYGFFIRHVKGLEMSNVEISYMTNDFRPAFVLNDVQGADFRFVKAPRAEGVPTFVLKTVEAFSAFQCQPVPDTRVESAEDKSF